ncbi:MAG: VWA domain-containing protein [Polyangiaceae bacterium]|nr:VWA domain-containing protein [Polyangiaceae bacterium]
MRSHLAPLLAVTSLCAAAACGTAASEPPPAGFGGDGGTAAGGTGGGVSGRAGVGGGGGAGAGGSAASGGGGGIVLDAASDTGGERSCGSITEQATTTPLHLYVMFDKSNSMAGNPGTSKWDYAKNGFIAFAEDAESAGIDVALRFFPRVPDGTPGCDQTAYKNPTVAYGVLPGNSQPLVDAINAEVPNGLSTPTYPALGGAILRSLDTQAAYPNDATAVLLVTDGAPQGPAPTCAGVDPELTQTIADLAAVGLASGVPTYVIAVPGVPADFANAVAAAGGTGQAIVIGTANAEQEFRDAFLKIRGQALPCDLELPPKVVNGQFAYDEVNVIVTPSGGIPSTLEQSASCASADGWRYDDPTTPTRIELCPAACDSLEADYRASITIELGCPTVVVRRAAPPTAGRVPRRRRARCSTCR